MVTKLKDFTDEQIADALIEIGAGFWFSSNKALMSEAAARLRTHARKAQPVAELNPSGFALDDGKRG